MKLLHNPELKNPPDNSPLTVSNENKNKSESIVNVLFSHMQKCHLLAQEKLDKARAAQA